MNNIECPFCFIRGDKDAFTFLPRGAVECNKCHTVFPKQVIKNPFLYTLSKDVITDMVY